MTEYRFDWRTEREPSCEDIVFWRDTGMKDDDEDVDAREGACSMETAMTRARGRRRRGLRRGARWCCRGMLFHHGSRRGDWRRTKDQDWDSGTCATLPWPLRRPRMRFVRAVEFGVGKGFLCARRARCLDLRVERDCQDGPTSETRDTGALPEARQRFGIADWRRSRGGGSWV